jgi:hypothetical protein
MKAIILSFIGLVSIHTSAFSQTATDLNEGSRLLSLGSDNYQFTWWARSRAYYLVDVSENLYDWNYIPTVFAGTGGISAPVNFNLTGEKFFVRLNTDPFNTDADGDGIPDAWEVLYGLNPRNVGDAAADADGDGISNLSEFQQHLNLNQMDNPAVGLSAFGFTAP